MISPELVILPAWLAFVIVWIIGAMNTARTVKRAPGWDRILIAIGALATWLAIRASFGRGIVDAPILPASPVTFAIGVILLYGGVAFAIWARVHLGRYWSGTVTLKVGHQLIRSGPYAFVRNPIYTGILCGFLGVAFIEDRLFLLGTTALILLGFLVKIHQEEKLLAEQFGEAFATYKRDVASLVPGLW